MSWLEGCNPGGCRGNSLAGLSDVLLEILRDPEVPFLHTQPKERKAGVYGLNCVPPNSSVRS